MLIGRRVVSRVIELVIVTAVILVSTGSLSSFAADANVPVARQEDRRYYSAEISHVLEDAQRVASTLAVFVAAVWGYFKFFRGRTYRPRLEPKISGGFCKLHDRTYVTVNYEVKNVGLSKVVIGSKGSGLILLVPDGDWAPQFAHEIRWKPAAAFEVLEDHGWIEPGELVQEQRMLALDAVYPAVRLQLKLSSPESETIWTAMAIVFAGLSCDVSV